MHQYQNLTDQELIIPNIGVVAPRGTISSDTEIINSNLKLITNEHVAAPEVRVPTPQPQPVQAAPEPTTEEK